MTLKSINLSLILMLLVCVGFGAQTKTSEEPIKPFDNTEKWSFPYDAEADKTKRIQDGITAVKQHMTFAEAVTKLGAPDAVLDLRKEFFGLSPREDELMMRYRSSFSFRVIWYLSKRGTSANLNDKWFALYIAGDEKTVLARLANNIEIPKSP